MHSLLPHIGRHMLAGFLQSWLIKILIRGFRCLQPDLSILMFLAGLLPNYFSSH